MNEFIERRSARLLAEAEYLPEGSAEQTRRLVLGYALCGQEPSHEEHVLQLLRPITDADPTIGWYDFARRAAEELSDEVIRLDGDVPPDRAKTEREVAELMKRIFKD